jgi:hypothetical protein
LKPQMNTDKHRLTNVRKKRTTKKLN